MLMLMQAPVQLFWVPTCSQLRGCCRYLQNFSSDELLTALTLDPKHGVVVGLTVGDAVSVGTHQGQGTGQAGTDREMDRWSVRQTAEAHRSAVSMLIV